MFAFPDGITHYTRSCLHDVDPLTPTVHCGGVNNTAPGTCDMRCSTSLCNHSSTAQLALSLRAAALITTLIFALFVKHM